MLTHRAVARAAFAEGGEGYGQMRGRPSDAVPGAPFYMATTLNRRSRRTGPGERASAVLPGREGGHRLQAPHSSHPPKVAWESVG